MALYELSMCPRHQSLRISGSNTSHVRKRDDDKTYTADDKRRMTDDTGWSLSHWTELFRSRNNYNAYGPDRLISHFSSARITSIFIIKVAGAQAPSYLTAHWRYRFSTFLAPLQSHSYSSSCSASVMSCIASAATPVAPEWS